MSETTTKSKPRYGAVSCTLFMLRHAWKHCRIVLWLLAALIALSVGDSLLRLFAAPVILDQVQSAAALSVLSRTILLFTLGLMLAAALSAYCRNLGFFGRIELRIELIRQVTHKQLTTSWPNLGDDAFKKLCAGASNATNANSKATEAIWDTLFDLTRSAIGFVIYLLLLSSVNPLIIAATIVTSAASFCFSLNTARYRASMRDEKTGQWNRIGYINYRASRREFAKDVRLFGMAGWLGSVYDSAANAIAAFEGRAQKRELIFALLNALLAFLRGGVIYAYLIAATLRAPLTASEFLLLFSAAGSFSTWIMTILQSASTLYNQCQDISTVREAIEFPEPFTFEGGEALTPDPDGRYELRLEDVSFRYPGAEKDTLTHISLTLHPGEKLAVVGLNGAGKTTLIRLMCGFVDPTEGRVLLNGKDIRAYNRRDYYRLFGAVFQDFSMLAASVAANVAQRVDAIDMERVKRCVALAGLTEKIESLPQGYDTLLGREVYEDAPELSGGELQRLMLSRALYKNAPLILLDEPTAALDPLAESDMYSRYNELTQGRSAVYISHRLASTRFCDRILLIDGGALAEEGTHDQLMAAGGQYARLYEIQSRYYGKENIRHEEA